MLAQRLVAACRHQIHFPSWPAQVRSHQAAWGGGARGWQKEILEWGRGICGQSGKEDQFWERRGITQASSAYMSFLDLCQVIAGADLRSAIGVAGVLHSLSPGGWGWDVLKCFGWRVASNPR